MVLCVICNFKEYCDVMSKSESSLTIQVDSLARYLGYETIQLRKGHAQYPVSCKKTISTWIFDYRNFFNCLVGQVAQFCDYDSLINMSLLGILQQQISKTYLYMSIRNSLQNLPRKHFTAGQSLSTTKRKIFNQTFMALRSPGSAITDPHSCAWIYIFPRSECPSDLRNAKR